MLQAAAAAPSTQAAARQQPAAAPKAAGPPAASRGGGDAGLPSDFFDTKVWSMAHSVIGWYCPSLISYVMLHLTAQQYGAHDND